VIKPQRYDLAVCNKRCSANQLGVEPALKFSRITLNEFRIGHRTRARSSWMWTTLDVDHLTPNCADKRHYVNFAVLTCGPTVFISDDEYARKPGGRQVGRRSASGARLSTEAG
jgi:hypothetical protein